MPRRDRKMIRTKRDAKEFIGVCGLGPKDSTNNTKTCTPAHKEMKSASGKGRQTNRKLLYTKLISKRREKKKNGEEEREKEG